MREGCTSAGIGCVECKQPVIEAVLAELEPIQKRAAEFSKDTALVQNIIADGCQRAREVAEETMEEVREAIGLVYR